MKIKTAQGSYEVKYVGSLEAEPKAEVKHDDGYVERDYRESLRHVLMERIRSLSLVKWADIDFRPTHPAQPLENEYGESRREDLLREDRS